MCDPVWPCRETGRADICRYLNLADPVQLQAWQRAGMMGGVWVGGAGGVSASGTFGKVWDFSGLGFGFNRMLGIGMGEPDGKPAWSM